LQVGIVLALLLAASPGGKAVPAAALFSSTRHPSVVNEAGPYRIQVTQVLGPRPRRGKLHFDVRRNEGTKRFQVDLRPAEDGRSWGAAIPGQPAGSEIFYRFAFELPDGSVVSHPRNSASRYRFRVVPIRLVHLNGPLRPPASAGDVHVTAVLESSRPPKGSVLYKDQPGKFDKSADLRVKHRSDNTYLVSATLPARSPGAVIDFYFEFTGIPEGTRFPADAPSRFYSYKVASWKTTALTGGAAVSALTVAGPRLWVGLEGGGLLEGELAKPPTRRTGVDGLPSSVVRSLARDSAEGIVYAGTRNGAVALRESAGTVDLMLAPSFYVRGHPLFGRLNAALDVKHIIVSALDGSVLMHSAALEKEWEETQEAVVLQLSNGRLSLAPLSRGGARLSQITAMAFDEFEGCAWFGAIESGGTAWSRPAMIRQCGDVVESFPIATVLVGRSPATPVTVEAFGRDPQSGALVVALRYSRDRPGRRELRSGLFLLREKDLVPLSSELTDIVAPVSTLLPEWAARRLLIGTLGEGLFSWSAGRLQKIELSNEAACLEITSSAMDAASGEILAGTRCGVFRVRDREARPLFEDQTRTGPIRPDLNPVDRDGQRGRILLSSGTGGLTVLEPKPGGNFAILHSLGAGREIPAGLYGDAAFDGSGVLLHAAVRSTGLLRVFNDRRYEMLATAQGLHRNDVWRLLRHPQTGFLWLLFPPRMPGQRTGGGIQIYAGRSDAHFIALPDENLATIGDLLFVPERGTVFAAGMAGVLEFHNDGRFERLSSRPVAALDRDARTGAVVAAGTALERWDGKRFQAITSIVQHPRFPPRQFYLRPATSLTIDGRGHWHVLHPGGYLITRDSEGRPLRVADWEDGIPVSAQTVVYEPASDCIIVGSSEEGVVFLHKQ